MRFLFQGLPAVTPPKFTVTARPWKWMVEKRSFGILGQVTFDGTILNVGSAHFLPSWKSKMAPANTSYLSNIPIFHHFPLSHGSKPTSFPFRWFDLTASAHLGDPLAEVQAHFTQTVAPELHGFPHWNQRHLYINRRTWDIIVWDR